MIKTILQTIFIIFSLFNNSNNDKPRRLNKQEAQGLLTSDLKVIIILSLMIMLLLATIIFHWGACLDSGNYYHMLNRGVI